MVIIEASEVHRFPSVAGMSLCVHAFTHFTGKLNSLEVLMVYNLKKKNYSLKNKNTSGGKMI